jgi:hypothetical protein
MSKTAETIGDPMIARSGFAMDKTHPEESQNVNKRFLTLTKTIVTTG